MKNSLKYRMLWQKKRNELPLDADPAAGWQEMNALLNQHLPVTPPESGGKPGGNGGSQLFKGFNLKLLSTVLLVPAAATFIYVATHQNKAKHKAHGQKRDSIAAILPVDQQNSINNVDSVQNTKDTLLLNDDRRHAEDVTAYNNGAMDTATKSAGPNKSRNSVNGLILISHQHRENTVSYSAYQQTKNAANINRSPFAESKESSADSMSIDYSHQFNPAKGNGEQKRSDSSTMLLLSKDTGMPPGESMFLNAALPGFSFTRMQPMQIHGFDLAEEDYLGKHSFNYRKNNRRVKMPRLKKEKGERVHGSLNLNMDWGLLTGFSVSGSPKLPDDLYFGIFTRFNLGEKWALSPQLQINSAYKLSGTYTHKNESTRDTFIKTLTIKDTRKVYNAQLPIYLEYKLSPRVSIKGGPIIGLATRQGGGNSSLQPDSSIRRDSTYRIKVFNALDKTVYKPGINYGFALGASINFNRFIIEATYLKQLSKQKISSDLGSYTSSPGTLQIGVGFRLNKIKNENK